MLHNVMSIFTFVGGGLLQQDDNYSLQIITTTLQTIVPALLQVRRTMSILCSAPWEVVGRLSKAMAEIRPLKHLRPRKNLCRYTR